MPLTQSEITAQRAGYVIALIIMWAIMSFPIIFDVVVCVLEWVYMSVPKEINHQEVLSQTPHKQFYRDVVMPKS